MNHAKTIAIAAVLSLSAMSWAHADKSYYEYVDVPAADPGDPPPAPSATTSFRLAVGGTLLSISIVAMGVVGLSKKGRKPKLIAVGLLSFVALCLLWRWGANLSDNADHRRWTQEQQTWQKNHDAWKNGDTIKEKVEIKPNRSRREDFDDRH